VQKAHVYVERVEGNEVVVLDDVDDALVESLES
jgi:hypothetical protein